MKTLRYKSGYRGGDLDRGSYAFFILGAMVVIAIVFFLGFHVGRIAEKSASRERSAAKPSAKKKESIRKEMSTYSDEAVRIPVVSPPAAPPPDAGEDLRKTEATATFPESLTRKDPAPQPLVKPKANSPGEASGKNRYMLQIGALKSKETADSLRGRLEREGFRSKVVRFEGKGRGEDLYRIRIGPHGSREEALKAMKAIKYNLKLDVILLKD